MDSVVKSFLNCREKFPRFFSPATHWKLEVELFVVCGMVSRGADDNASGFYPKMPLSGAASAPDPYIRN